MKFGVIEIVYGAIAFVIGILIAYGADKIYTSIKKRFSSKEKIRSRIRRLQQVESEAKTTQNRYVIVGPEIIGRIARHDVIGINEIDGLVADALEQSGFLIRCGSHGYLVNRNKVRGYIDSLRNIEWSEHTADMDVAKYLLSRYGVANIIIYKIDREEGLVEIYRVGNTRLTELLDNDGSIVDNLFMVGNNLSTANIQGTRIVVHSTETHFIIAEVIGDSDIESVLGALRKLRIPESVEELRDALMTL